MKSFFTCLIAVLLLWGCSSTPREKSALSLWMEETGKVKVLATTEIVGDLVRFIGGDRIDSLCLIVGDQDPHSYELVKGDEEKFSRADLVFCHGLGLEHGASLQHRLHLDPKVIAVGDEIRKKYPEKILHKDEQIDPHVWMDVSLWKEGIDAIVSSFARFDPEGEDHYSQNGKLLREQLDGLDREIEEKLHLLPEEKRYLVTTHDAYHYFARRYLSTEEESVSGGWEKRIAAPEGLAPEGQIGFGDLHQVIDFLKTHQINVIYPESNLGRGSLKKIVEVCSEMGHRVEIAGKHLYGDTLGSEEGVTSYFEMMRVNAETLYEGWQ